MMFGWLRYRFGWSAHIRVRIADIGPEARALRRLIVTWLPEAPDPRPALRLGPVEIVVLHHVRVFGQSGPVVPALTERVGGLTRVCLGRFRPDTGSGWRPYTVAELLTALEAHLAALARNYERTMIWWPGVEALVEPAVTAPAAVALPAPGAPASAASRPALPASRRLPVRHWRYPVARAVAPDTSSPDKPVTDVAATGPSLADSTLADRPVDAPTPEAGRWPSNGAARPE